MFVFGENKDNFFETYTPRVHFHIVSDLTGCEYVRWLTDHFQAFIRFLSNNMRNESAASRFYFSAVGQQGGVGGIHIGEKYFDSCKLYVYDGGERGFGEDKKGIVMRDHEDIRSKVAPVYELAEWFEKYLVLHNVPYTRFGYTLNREEVVQVTDPAGFN